MPLIMPVRPLRRGSWRFQAVLAGLVFFLFYFYRYPSLPKNWVYGALREVSRWGMEFKTRSWLEMENNYFVVRYQPGDEKAAALVLDTAEKVRGPVTGLLGARLPGKVLILVYPDRGSLARSFGWAAGANAMGVYWMGVIRVLSPSDWLEGTGGKGVAEEFLHNGPMAHELTHLLVDYLAAGNYPRWLTEGLAEYVDRSVTGFEFPQPARTDTGYGLAEMDSGFDLLPDQSKAYWQALAFTEYLSGQKGLRPWLEVLASLGRGTELQEAMLKAFGAKPAQLEAAFWRRQGQVAKAG